MEAPRIFRTAKDILMKKLLMFPVAALCLSLAACATDYGSSSYSSGYGSRGYDNYDNRAYSSYGTVETVYDVNLSSGPNPTGAILGAIVGGVVGNQVGSGSGRTAATIAGAGVGGYVGNRIQENQNNDRRGQEIVVRLDNGSTIRVVQPGSSLYSGARVKVTGSGSSTRVSRL